MYRDNLKRHLEKEHGQTLMTLPRNFVDDTTSEVSDVTGTSLNSENTEDERTITCNSCEKAFSRRDSLRRHMRSVHGQMSPRRNAPDDTMSEASTDVTETSESENTEENESTENEDHESSEDEESETEREDLWTSLLHINQELTNLLRRTIEQKREDIQEKAKLLDDDDDCISSL